jgi:teichuronic acid biosynthesis glycosyltransferase TuaG
MISIITPCYNSVDFISQTIDSVIAQTYTDWEMIIVDDNSKDNSPEIIQAYCRKDPRIKYIRTERSDRFQTPLL